MPAGDHATSAAPPGPAPAWPSPGGGGCRLRRSRPVVPARLQGAGSPRPGPAPGRRARGGDRRIRRRTDVARAHPVRGRRGPTPRRSARRAVGSARSTDPVPAWRRGSRRADPGADLRPSGHGRVDRRRARDCGCGQVRRPTTPGPHVAIDPGDRRRRSRDHRQHGRRRRGGSARRWPAGRRRGRSCGHPPQESMAHRKQRRVTIRCCQLDSRRMFTRSSTTGRA